MLPYSLYVCILALSCVSCQLGSQLGGQTVSNKAVLLAQLKSEITKLGGEQQLLAQEKLKVDNLITETKNQCSNNVAKIKEQHQVLLSKASENIQVMYKLIEELKNEEEVHRRLEAELKRLSEVLELYHNKYDVVFGELNLLNSRRENGTMARCSELSLSLSTLNEGALNIRSGLFLQNDLVLYKRKLSDVDIQFKMQQSILGMRTVEKTKSVLAVNDAKRVLQTEQDNCALKTKSEHILLEESKKAARTAEESKAAIEEDLKISREFSTSVRLEIKTGSNYIHQLRLKVSELWRNTNTFKEDIDCYNKIKKLD